MIISRNGYPITPELLARNRSVVGYELEKMRASKVDFHPAMDGKASNPRSMEALTPASIEAISEDIASKYGVFLLNQSEIRVYPTKTREAEQL